MKKFLLISAILIVICITAGYFALQREALPSTELAATPQVTTPILTPPTTPPVTPKTAITQKQSLIESLPLAQAAQSAAAHYEYTISLPPYSQPLGKGDFDRLNPNHSMPSKCQLKKTTNKYLCR